MKQAMLLEQESKVDFKPICTIAQGVAHPGDECEHADLANRIFLLCASRKPAIGEQLFRRVRWKLSKRPGAADAAETLS